MGARAQGEGGRIPALLAQNTGRVTATLGGLGVDGARASLFQMRYEGKTEESNEHWKSC